MTDVRMYYGAASGQQRSALRRLEPEGVMISHATQNNGMLLGDHETFIDCGGYHHMVSGAPEYDDSDREYLAYIHEHRPDLWALRDYPCEPDLLDQIGRSVADQQRRTTDKHISLYNIVSGSWMADRAVVVVQGWTLRDYLECLDAFRDHGLPLDRVAIGSVCRRGQDEDIAEIVLALRDELGEDAYLHAFGVKSDVLRFREVADALDSVDSAAYDVAESRVPSTRSDGESFTWRDSARAYLNWRHRLQQQIGTESLHDDRTYQQTLVADGRGDRAEQEGDS
jgi:hypothetical protein